MSEDIPSVRPGLNEPRSFADIVGQASSIKALRARIGSADRSTGLLLHGPEGVGKRTLARLYSKAVRCEHPTEGGDPCGVCENCVSFDPNGGFDYAEVEILSQGAERMVQQLIDADGWQIVDQRRVIVLVNVDKIPSTYFDRLLPMLEKAKTRTDLVLLTCNLKSVRLAGVSRCQVLGLRPLAPDVARSLLADRLKELGTMADPQALDVLVAVGRGFPKRIDEICVRVGGRPHVTLATARQVLGVDWVDDAVAACLYMLAVWPSRKRLLAATDGLSSRERLRRVQVCLRHVYLHGLRKTPMVASITDPALLYRDDAMQEVAFALRLCAEKHSISVDNLWCALTARLLSGDLEDL